MAMGKLPLENTVRDEKPSRVVDEGDVARAMPAWFYKLNQ
jgi:hypothetical protein